MVLCRKGGVAMQQSRGGLGSRKHGISGRGGPSPKAKQNKTREANTELEATQKKKAKRKSAGVVHTSVADALKAQRRY